MADREFILQLEDIGDGTKENIDYLVGIVGRRLGVRMDKSKLARYVFSQVANRERRRILRARRARRANPPASPTAQVNS